MSDPSLLPIPPDPQEPERQPELWPAELVFLPEAAPEVQATASPDKARPAGPGFWESLAWMIGYILVQMIAAVVASAALAAVYLLAQFDQADAARITNPTELLRGIEPHLEQNLAAILGLTGLTTVIYAAMGVSLRLRRQQGLRGLGWQLPSAGHLLLLVMGILPLSLMCTELQRLAFEIFPGSEGALEEMFLPLAQSSLGQLWLAMAVAPALGEELLFRGLIGTGLLARWGLFRGVIITSILFGLLHLNPAQALGVIPIGIAMHLAYLATRSIWAPILIHLLNNSFAALMLKYSNQIPLGKLLEGEEGLPLPLMTVSAALLVAIALLLWQTRVQWTRRDGSTWGGWMSQGQESLHLPELVSSRQSPRPLLLACGAINSLGFAAVIWRLVAAH
ncbi:MAG: lysostaphin resistance A-like protein [Planctomycetales bacterium]